MTAENHTYILNYTLLVGLSPQAWVRNQTTSPKVLCMAVHPERILQFTAIHPVTEVLALAVMPPDLPEDGRWGRGETKSAAVFSLCSEEKRMEAWALNQK